MRADDDEFINTFFLKNGYTFFFLFLALFTISHSASVIHYTSYCRPLELLELKKEQQWRQLWPRLQQN